MLSFDAVDFEEFGGVDKTHKKFEWVFGPRGSFLDERNIQNLIRLCKSFVIIGAKNGLSVDSFHFFEIILKAANLDNLDFIFII